MDYLKMLKEEVHSTVFATTDERGLPVTCVTDVMLTDAGSLYFITAKGKGFYKRLKVNQFAAVSGMWGSGGTMTKKSISLRGKVRNIGVKLLPEIFEENPYMAEIYQTVESRAALEVFQMYEGEGVFFDLSVKPPVREVFTFGGAEKRNIRYFITDKCIACGACVPKCPTQCIKGGNPYEIMQRNCIHCGNCKEICPVGAVVYVE